jgi:NDP-sugar pyrophosphorylase family protein
MSLVLRIFRMNANADNSIHMKAVILAGGLGTRLRPFTEVLPKPLLPIGDRAILEHQITSLRAAGVTDIWVATNYKSDLIQAYLGDGSKYGVRLHISRETIPLGTAGPLRLLSAELLEPFLVMNGDILTKLDFRTLYDFACGAASDLTVGTKVITTPFRFGNVVVDEENHIVCVEEKPDFRLEVLAGIYCMKPGIFRHIPENTYFGVDSLIKTLLAEGESVARFLIQDYWIDIGQVEDYTKARDTFAIPKDAAEA